MHRFSKESWFSILYLSEQSCMTAQYRTPSCGFTPKRFGSLLATVAVFLATALSTPATAQLRIEISGGVTQAVPIAVVPFAWNSPESAPIEAASVIAADLRRSGRFSPLTKDDMISRPTTARAVNFTDWRLLKTDYVVIGELRDDGGDRYTLRFQVFDVFRETQLISYQIPASASTVRAAAHRASDMIFEEITGIPGAFSTRIAYVSVEGDGAAREYSLFVADADGANPAIVVRSAEPIMSPAWSPDGRRLAYVSFEGKRSSIYVQELSSGKRKQVSAHPGINGAPSFSPDGRWLALTLSGNDGNLDIHVLNPATNQMRRLTRNPAIDTEPAWSGDGREIYFTSDRSGGPQVYKVSAAGGGNVERVTFEGTYNARPRISPDGKSLAVVHNDRGNYRIGLVDLESKSLRILSDGQQDESPSFAPNGTMIIYATRSRGRGVLAAVAVDGNLKQNIASAEGDVREPVWSP
jgi:TolB protein